MMCDNRIEERRGNDMNTNGKIIADFPAYSIHEATPKMHYGVGKEIVAAKAGDVIAIPFETDRYGTMYNFFKFGSAVSYALDCDADPIEAYEVAVKRGEPTHWLISMGVTLTNMKTEKVARVALNWGDTVAFEGREFRVEKALNDNAKLVEVK
jgi:hypothetical protein